jgi:RNase H-like domain found in reverse transcriptase
LSNRVLKPPEPENAYFLECDASAVAMRAVLFHVFNYWPHPVRYFSAKFSDAELNYSTYEKEFLSIINALKNWSYLLQGSPFVNKIKQIIKIWKPSPKFLLQMKDTFVGLSF